MALPLKQSRAVRNLAETLYDFLPGSGHGSWKGHVTFETVAEKAGVGDFWQGGSKNPALCSLLERTLEFRRRSFEPLVVEIVRCGLTYRQKQRRPVTPEELDRINGLILEVGFKFPDLWDPDFRASLCVDGPKRAQERVEEARAVERLRETERSRRSVELGRLKDEFLGLCQSPDRQAAGRSLEGLLNRLFGLHDLAPREPFRVVGEEIDGSFELDHEVYLLEAKWHEKPSGIDHLYVFREKVGGKSPFTRGAFFSINGITTEAAEALTQGKTPLFFVVNGHDLLMLLEGMLDLTTFLRRRWRFLGEGRVCVPFNEVV